MSTNLSRAGREPPSQRFGVAFAGVSQGFRGNADTRKLSRSQQAIQFREANTHSRTSKTFWGGHGHPAVVDGGRRLTLTR